MKILKLLGGFAVVFMTEALPNLLLIVCSGALAFLAIASLAVSLIVLSDWCSR